MPFNCEFSTAFSTAFAICPTTSVPPSVGRGGGGRDASNPLVRPLYDHLIDLRQGDTADAIASVREIRERVERTTRQLVEV